MSHLTQGTLRVHKGGVGGRALARIQGAIAGTLATTPGNQGVPPTDAETLGESNTDVCCRLCRWRRFRGGQALAVMFMAGAGSG